jgi:LysM repeat protein
VRNGESLWTIARKYNVTVNSIKNANKLKSEDLDIGQSLKIQK